MKDFLERMKYFFSVKKHIYMTIGISLLVIVLIVVAIVLAIVLKRYSYEEIEYMMVSSAKSYMNVHKDSLPNEVNTSFELEANRLIEEGYLKEFSKLSNDNGCIGKVMIYYNNGKYRYTPTLICENYETTTLKEKILDIEDITTSEDGLYLTDKVYRYKGDYVNNYVNFADKSWRLFRMSDGLFYLVLANVVTTKNSETVYDDRYNEDAESAKGKSDYDLSRIKDKLEEIYQNELSNYDNYITLHKVCKNSRSKEDTLNNGEIECFTTSEAKISLMAAYDFMGGSRDNLCLTVMAQNCMNYNYLTKVSNKWWLITPNNEFSYRTYFVTQRGYVDIDYPNSKKWIRYVITLPDDVIYKDGNGTEDNPYSIYVF